MDKVSLKIKLIYDKLGKAEKQIADWIIENPRKIISLSIVELAEKCKCSEATIVRFSKKLGLSGYQELKISLASESGSSSVSTHVSKNDSPYEIYEKVCNDIYLSLEKTKKSLKPDAILEAADKICSAEKIVIFGLGNSASIAVDAQHKFLRVGLNASACNDNHMQAIIASHLNNECVAIGITHSGQSTDIVQALKIAKLNNATTICITNFGQSPITEVSDICLFTKSAETKHSLLAMSSRIAQLTIFDCLYTYIIANSDSDAVKAIHNTESALKDKKM
jgi:DNA-binding MurR/RpiR family transcriptional regulator